MRVAAVVRKKQEGEEGKEQLPCKEMTPQQPPHFIWDVDPIPGTTLKSLQGRGHIYSCSTGVLGSR